MRQVVYPKMLTGGTVNQLDFILPCTDDVSSHDTLHLEHLCALKIMECDINTAYQIIRNLSPVMFEPVLQTMILNCYLKYINTLWTTGQCLCNECEAH